MTGWNKSPEAEKRLSDLDMEPAYELRRTGRRSTGIDWRGWKRGVHVDITACCLLSAGHNATLEAGDLFQERLPCKQGVIQLL